MADKQEILDELLKQADGGKILDQAGSRLDNLIHMAKYQHYTKEEFIEVLPTLCLSIQIVDGKNMDEDMARIIEYVNDRWDYVNN